MRLPSLSDFNEFAISNGLLVNEEIAEKVIGEMGTDFTCPYTEKETCPCKALEAITSGDSEEITCPAGVFYKPTDDESEAAMQEAAMKLQSTFDEVRDLVSVGDNLGAMEVLQAKMEETDCSLCQTLLQAEAYRIGAMDCVCKLPGTEACKMERDQFEKRFQQRMKDVSDITTELGSFTPETKPKSPYHACVSDHPLDSEDDLAAFEVFQEQYRHGAKMSVRAKMCGTKAMSFEDALGATIEVHPDWLEEAEVEEST